MTDQPVRIGLVGAGGSLRGTHIRDLQAIAGVDVVSVANRSGESSKRVADEFGIPRVYDDWVKLVAAPDSDAIFIGTWPYMHRAVAVSALEHGKHVLTQARMANDAREAREMLEASLGAPHLVAQVVPTKSTFMVDATFIELIDNGYLGEILSADITSGESVRVVDAAFTFRHDRDLSGFNVMDLGMMAEGMMRWLGPASSVTALTRVHAPRRVDRSGNRRFTTVPDHVEVLAEMASGPIFHMRISLVAGNGTNAIWLFGSEGTLHFDAISKRLFGGRKDDGTLSEIEIPAEKQRGRNLVEAFIDAIRGIETVGNTSFEDGLRYMEFTEAVTRSAQTRQTVYLPGLRPQP